MAITREVYQNRQDLRQILDGQSLAKAYATAPDLVNSMLTFEMGWGSNDFPLSYLTEGQGKMKPIKAAANGVYVWDVMGAKIDTAMVTSATASAQGYNNSVFKVTFKTNFFIIDHIAISPSGVICRVIGQPVPVAAGYEVTLKIISLQTHVPAADFAVGKYWGQGVAVVSASQSKGNASNHQLPSRRINQISWMRQSYHIAGNAKNMEMKNIEMNMPGGGKVKTIVQWAEWQHTYEWKQYQEEFLWFDSKYNRLPNGEIVAKDDDNGHPIPMGASVDQICEEANFDTYDTNISLQKLYSNIDGLLYANDSKTENKTVIIFTGSLGCNMVDKAIKREGANQGLLANLTMQYVRDNYKGLDYGANFRGFLTPDGHKVILKTMNILDKGVRAKMDILNGNIDPESGKPRTSGDMYLICAENDGKPNINMYYEEGRSFIRGVLKGMSPVPEGWGFSGNTDIATDQDQSSLHFLASKGVNIENDKYCMKMQYEL